MELTNLTNLPLSIAVWLATDNYDHSTNPNLISATTFNKPIRAIVLARQNKELQKLGDIASLIPSRFGTALHDAIEASWINHDNLMSVLTRMGYPEAVIKRFVVNPKQEDLTPTCIPIYLEQRAERNMGDFTVSGKFDIVIEGQLEDFKSTSTYSYIHGTNTQDYIRQGSIYRWLHPEIVTSDHMQIQFLFTDWSVAQSRQSKTYPQSRIVSKTLELMSIPETERYVKNALDNITSLMNATQAQLPECTPDELWQRADVYKYYKNPEKKVRSTKNYDNQADAYMHMAKDGNVGVVDRIQGSIQRCRYCDVCEICDQAQMYVEQNLLTLT